MNLNERIKKSVRAWLGGAAETDLTFTTGISLNNEDRDRYPYDLTEVLEQSLEAWRVNPIARRIVSLTTQYVVGSGISVTCKHTRTGDFINSFWANPLNRMDTRVMEWCDELSRTGNLFILVSTDPAGMSYVRAVPATSIERIEARPNDIEQPVRFYPKPTIDEPDPSPWRAYILPWEDEASSLASSPTGDTFMLHYAINRPVGGQWGEPDLAPLLKWISRYASWLEDRARLNRYRNSFLFVVKAAFSSEAQRIARQQQLNLTPPAPGSILVTNENEEWTVLAPSLESADANTDGLALKKMISAGAGVPLHFLAEPESSTRTTAEAAGGPTFRHYEQRQNFFMWMLRDVLRVVVERRSMVDRRVHTDADIEVTGADISARDNAALSIAAASIIPVLEKLRDRALIDDTEMLRLVYRFCGESVDAEEVLKKGMSEQPPVRYDLLVPAPDTDALKGSDSARVSVAPQASTTSGVSHPKNPLNAAGDDVTGKETGETAGENAGL